MKIAISSKGTDLEAKVDPQFGRCRYLIIVDSATGEFEVVDNKAAAMSGSAGIQAAQTVVNTGADAVVTGSLGPNANNVLTAAGLKVYLGAAGSVREALQEINSGRLQDASNSARDVRTGSVAGRYAQGDSRAMGRGMGAGRRWGRGGGRGLGPAGECVCINCGAKLPHQAGVPCFELQCPRCAGAMRRF